MPSAAGVSDFFSAVVSKVMGAHCRCGLPAKRTWRDGYEERGGVAVGVVIHLVVPGTQVPMVDRHCLTVAHVLWTLVVIPDREVASTDVRAILRVYV